MEQQNFWIAVASADHVADGITQGCMQVCHGKGGPLRRLKGGDGVVYYSPAQTMGGKDGLQSFTAIGIASPRAPYLHETCSSFTPYRRDVAWQTAQITPIRPLLPLLNLTEGQRNWGYAFRYGIVKITAHDFDLIHAAMTQTCTATA
jgi:hypothetical protein